MMHVQPDDITKHQASHVVSVSVLTFLVDIFADCRRRPSLEFAALPTSPPWPTPNVQSRPCIENKRPGRTCEVIHLGLCKVHHVVSYRLLDPRGLAPLPLPLLLVVMVVVVGSMPTVRTRREEAVFRI